MKINLKPFFVIFAGLAFPAFIVAQQAPQLHKWWVAFDHKAGTPFSIHRPAEFLSARSLARRERSGIAVTEEDLPVDPTYLAALRAAGVRVHHTSRWLNAATIIADTAQIAAVRALPFVKEVKWLGWDIRIKNQPNKPPKKRAPARYDRNAEKRLGPDGAGVFNHGEMGVTGLHEIGARGRGVWIAVMDGGFTNADTLPHFDSVALAGRLWPGPDFVERDGAVFESAQHGSSVLSVMASDLPGLLIGGAPDATYFLVKTEDTGGELPVEEANWIAGAEWADSIGVDIVNASLGYTSFSDTTLNHRYSDLDGRGSIGSRGASVAARKGMIIFNSAGNSGDEPWRFVGVPADAPGVIAVGAVDGQATDQRAPFSSIGPTADGRIKPDLVAPGFNVVTCPGVGSGLEMSAGTSIASPILASGVAALWSAFPDKSAERIIQALYRNADQHDRPDNERGYGMPDLMDAYLELGEYRLIDAETGFYAADYLRGMMRLLPAAESFGETCPYILQDNLGRTIAQGVAQVCGGSIQTVEIDGLEQLPHGHYRLILPGEKSAYRFGVGW